MTTIERMTQIQSQIKPFVAKCTESKVVDNQARYVTWDFKKSKFSSLEIIQITDIQFGHKQCHVASLKEYVNWVLAADNRFVLLGGDLVDAGHKTSKGSPFEQIGDPQHEVWELLSILAPLRHRILGYVGGNHERRSIDGFGDLGKLIATVLQIPYSPGNQLIDVRFGDHQPFKISLHHGTGAAATTGGIASNLEKFTFKGDSQWYLLGHLHRPMSILSARESRDGNGDIHLSKVIGSRGSSFLGYYGTYTEVIMNGNPTLIAMPLARLERNGKWAVELR